MDITALANFGLVLLFVLIGGLFAGTEMAIVNLREAQIQKLERSGERGESTARLVRDPNLFLSAVQIGVTVAGFFSSAYGASDRKSTRLNSSHVATSYAVFCLKK